MGLTLTATTLLSRVIRRNVSNGKVGTDVLNAATEGTAKLRKINFLSSLQKKQEGKGILSFLFNTGKALAGFIGGALGFIGWSVSAIWGWVVSGVNALKAFNWNASDKELKGSIEQQNIQLASIWGGVVGQGIGWLTGIAVGYGISLVVPVIGSGALARAVAGKVAIEAKDELIPSLKAAIATTIRILAGKQLTNLYINYRRFLKNLPRPILETIYGKDGADFITKVWGNEGGPNMSFNTQMDEAVESIKNPALQAFVEELLEESWDSFVESGFIIAQELDDAYQQNKLLNKKGTLGSPRTVVITPDRDNDNEQLVIEAVPQQLIMPAVQQAINTHRLVDNRDIGQLVGERVEDYARAMPLALRAQIKLFSVKQPPYVSTSKRRIKEVTVSIPDLDRAKIDWNRIKQACGGDNGYMWGRFKATAQLSNGRPFIVYGATADEAEDRLKAYLTLTTAELSTINITEEKKQGARLKNPKLQKEATRVYPAYFTIINRDLQVATDLGKPTKRGNYRDRSNRIELWTSTKPSDFEEVVQELLKKATL